VRCTVQHNEWQTNPSNSGSICANQVDNWFGNWPEIETCAHLNDTTDINVFLNMKNKTDNLNPALTKGLMITII
jgi:hypothetical protein